jgi:hypothetical protein
VSFLGDSLALVALMLHVASTTGRALAVALLLLLAGFAVSSAGNLFTGLAWAVAAAFALQAVRGSASPPWTSPPPP